MTLAQRVRRIERIIAAVVTALLRAERDVTRKRRKRRTR
jgi:hypothetical protein